MITNNTSKSSNINYNNFYFSLFKGEKYDLEAIKINCSYLFECIS